MPLELFGFKLKPTEKEVAQEEAKSFVAPTNEDGAITVQSSGYYGTYIDIDGAVKSEYELITRYREMSLLPEVHRAIDNITNDSIVLDGNEPPVDLDLSKLEGIPESIQEKIQTSFKEVCKLLDWKNQAYYIYRKWYIDGRLFYHIIIPDKANKKKGIEELRYIDPRQIKKIREINKKVDDITGAEIVTVQEEYYIYNAKGIQYQGSVNLAAGQTNSVQGIRIEESNIIYVHSGITDKFSSSILSNLHIAIKPANQLKMMEDAMVIYRIARAPERRIFYIDVGNLPKTKAQDYLNSVMAKYRTKMVYDVNTGEIRDDRRHLSMLEDFWLPRKEGSQGTEITTLPGGENLGKMEDVEYFQKKLYEALNVPVSRLSPDAAFTLGRSTEITRDELNFAKFIHRLRKRFESLFNELLSIQLELKNIMTRDDWDKIIDQVEYKWAVDNHFAELKNNEIMKGRLEMLALIDPDQTNYTRKYFSVEWVRANILNQTKEIQAKLDKEIDKEEAKYEELRAAGDGKATNFDDGNDL